MWGGVLRILGVLVAAAGVGGVALTPASPQSPGGPPGISAHCKASRDTFPRPAKPAGGKIVPVIVHYMFVVERRPDGPEPPERRDQNELVRQYGKKIQRHFGPPTGDPILERWNINDIWLSAGIQFHLLRTENCQYLVEEVTSIPLPIPTRTDIALFHELNQKFNAPGFRGVDLYVWPSFNDKGGYGSPRVSNTDETTKPGGVWVKAGVFELEGPYRKAKTRSPTDAGLPYDTVLLVAHEIGHFLALEHGCSIDGPEPRCETPGRNRILMSAWADGTEFKKPVEPTIAMGTVTRMRID